MAHKNPSSAARYAFTPDYAVIPGQTLQETIDAVGMDQKELALRTGLDKKTINQIIKGHAPLTPNTALLLERVTGVPAHFWNNLEANYQEQRTRLAEQARLQQDLEWLKRVPVGELVKRGHIKKHKDKLIQLHEVLQFFGMASVAAWRQLWQSPACAYRRSSTFQGKPEAFATWLRLGELAAQRIECAPFDKSRFRQILEEIRALTRKKPAEFIPEITRRCAKSGVAFVMVPAIPGAPTNGAARWLRADKAVIQLSDRHKMDDHFWFSFFHEAGHILLHNKKVGFVEDGQPKDQLEEEANQFARNFLMPAENENRTAKGRTSRR